MGSDIVTIDTDGHVFKDGRLVGSVDDDRVYNADGESIGHFDNENHVYDDTGTLVGTWDGPHFTYVSGRSHYLGGDQIELAAAAILLLESGDMGV